MNADRLLAHYEKIADAPDAIARLRRFILDLAVRGKLVPQDAGDEPASELLKRIAREKARLLKTGAFREPSSFVLIDRETLPFEPASHWAWARLIEIARPAYGFAFASARFNSSKRGMPLIRIRDISNTNTEAYFEGDYDPAYLVTEGDYLVGMDGDFNLRRWAGIDGLLNQRVMRINGWRCGIDPEFVKLPLQFILDHLHGQTSLTTVKHLSAKQVNGIEIPLPPLAEQHRIVAKVDELMGLCDRLAAARVGRERSRDRLTAASLARLNAPETLTSRAVTSASSPPPNVLFRTAAPAPVGTVLPEACNVLADHARFVLDALPALTTRPDQIKRLRQTILNLAVRGKLVPQDAKDKAPRLPPLRQFAAASGMDDEVFELFRGSMALPSGWQIAPLAQLSENIVDCPHTTPKWTESGEICIRTNQIRPRALDLSEPRYVSPEAYLERIERLEPKADDILYSREGGILGVACRVPPGIRLCLGQRLMLIRAGAATRADFLEIFLNSPFITDIAKARTTGGAAPRVNMSTVRAYPIPVPPLAEQHRIVAKVDALMALCDRLEESLTAIAATRRRLLDALLTEALAPVDSRDMEAAE